MVSLATKLVFESPNHVVLQVLAEGCNSLCIAMINLAAGANAEKSPQQGCLSAQVVTNMVSSTFSVVSSSSRCAGVQDSVQADLAALAVDTEQPESAQFALNFLWLNKNIAVAVDQLFDKVITPSSPLSLPVCPVSPVTSGAGCVCTAACKTPISVL